jgi:hypothetical protein
VFIALDRAVCKVIEPVKTQDEFCIPYYGFLAPTSVFQNTPGPLFVIPSSGGSIFRASIEKGTHDGRGANSGAISPSTIEIKCLVCMQR